jgi:type II secretion system protein I
MMLRPYAPFSRGLTLLEVIVAMSILLFSSLAIYHLVSIGTDRALDVQFHAKASMLCQSKLAELMFGGEPLSSSAAQSFKEEPEWQYEIDASDGDVTGLKKVRVTVKLEREGRTFVAVSLSRMILDPTMRGSTFDKLTGSTSGSTTPSSTTPSGSGGSTP